jgi:hypothetical protein
MINEPTNQSRNDQQGGNDERLPSLRRFWLCDATAIRARVGLRDLSVAGNANAAFLLVGYHIVVG